MYFMTKNKFKNFLVTILAVLLSLTLVFAAACSNNSGKNKGDKDKDKDTTTTVTDYQNLKNGDFEYHVTDKTTFPTTSSIGWSRSTDSDNSSTSPSSTGSSGVIDTADEKFEKLDAKNKYKTSDGNFVNPRSPYYYGLTKNEYDKDDTEKRVNANSAGTKVLMINNSYESGTKKGTAQSFKYSSSVSVDADGYAVISVWVKTYIESANGDGGAYIRVQHSGGENYYLDKINTNGNWAKFTIAVSGADLSSSSLSLYLGLGRANGTAAYQAVNGFAFFDDATLKTFTRKEFIEKGYGEITNVLENKTDLNGTSFKANPESKTEYSESNVSDNSTSLRYALNLRNDYSALTFSQITTGTFTNVPTNRLLPADAKCGAQKIPSDLSDSEMFKGISDTGVTDPDVIYMNFKTAYAMKFESSDIDIAAEEIKMITFFAKVKAENKASVDKAKIDVIDTLNENKVNSVLSSFETSEKDGNYGEWVKYTIFVENTVNVPCKFKIRLTFGPDKFDYEDSQDVHDLQSGYAVIADLKYATADSEIADKATAGTYVKKGISITGVKQNYSEDDDSESTDSYDVTVDLVHKNQIKTQPARYFGEYGFSKTENVTAGVINGKYVNSDNTYGADNLALNGLETFKNELKEGDNKYAQAIILDNKTSAKSYVVLNDKKTLAANSYAKITVKVRVTGNAVATVYVTSDEIDGDSKRFIPLTLTIGGETRTLSTKVTSASRTNDGWTEVTFFLASGKDAIDYRIEICNGSRTENSLGAIFFKNPEVSTDLTEETFKATMEEYVADYSELGAEWEKFGGEIKHTRAPLKTYTKDSKGNKVTTETTFEEKTVYIANDLIKFTDYSTTNAVTEIDNTKNSSTDDDNSGDNDSDSGYKGAEASVWLQVSSIIIAVAIIIALVAVFLKTMLKGRKTKKARVQSYYDRSTRDAAFKKISDSKKRKVDVSDDELSDEYDYDAASNVDESATDGDNVDGDATGTTPEEMPDEQKADEQVIDVNEIGKEPEEATEIPEANDGSDNGNE